MASSSSSSGLVDGPRRRRRRPSRAPPAPPTRRLGPRRVRPVGGPDPDGAPALKGVVGNGLLPWFLERRRWLSGLSLGAPARSGGLSPKGLAPAAWRGKVFRLTTLPCLASASLALSDETLMTPGGGLSLNGDFDFAVGSAPRAAPACRDRSWPESVPASVVGFLPGGGRASSSAACREDVVDNWRMVVRRRRAGRAASGFPRPMALGTKCRCMLAWSEDQKLKLESRSSLRRKTCLPKAAQEEW